MNKFEPAMILDAVIDNLKAEGLLQEVPRTHVLLAYSGGADSTALLFMLTQIREKIPLDITAAYFNHRWRGTPPPELPLIHQNCRRCNVPLVIIQADLALPQTESAARQARYRQLTHLAHDLHANAILTAHHADDQIETLMFRILRGTGLDGLTGIQKHLVLKETDGVPVPILRPMLDLAHRKIRAYVNENQLRYFDDPTNQDSNFQRNHIRHNIIPYLEQSYPQVKNSLFRLSLVVEGDLQILEDSINAIWGQVFAQDTQGPYLDAVRFNQLGLPYQRRLLKRFLAEARIFPDFQTIEELLAFVRGEGRRKMDSSLKSLITGEDGQARFLSLYKDRLRLIPVPPKVQPMEPIPVSTPGITPLAMLEMTFKAIPWEAPDVVKMCPIRPNDTREVFVNLSAYLDKPLVLRNRQPGDKFQPMGMTTPMRFKKFLINRGVPRFQRDQLLVLAHGDKILWVPGLGISQALRIPNNAPPTHLLKLVCGFDMSMEIITPLPVETRHRPDVDDDDDETDTDDGIAILEADDSPDDTDDRFDGPDTQETEVTGAPLS